MPTLRSRASSEIDAETVAEAIIEVMSSLPSGSTHFEVTLAAEVCLRTLMAANLIDDFAADFLVSVMEISFKVTGSDHFSILHVYI